MLFPFTELYRDICSGQTAALTFSAEGDTYIRNMRPQERLLLLGGGHISQPLCHYAADLGFRVTVADDRPSFANSSRFPEAEKIICNDFPHAIEEMAVTANDYVAILTRGHRYDADCLRTILKGDHPRYLGMIGSRRRVAALFNMLEEEGFSRGDLDRIHAPIGVDINALTVKEIALAIAAELIGCRRQDLDRRSHGTSLVMENIDHGLWRSLTEDDTPKSLLIVYDTSGSTPVMSGAMMTVDKNYRTAGTIGGGCSENAVMMDAYRLIGTGRQRCVTIDMSNDVAEDEGMVCGGTMKVWIADVSREE